MAHGLTLLLNNIPPPAKVWIHRHYHEAAWDRRHFRRKNGAQRTWPRDLRSPPRNVPYVNPSRDLKPTRFRRLRPERKAELAIQYAKVAALHEQAKASLP